MSFDRAGGVGRGTLGDQAQPHQLDDPVIGAGVTLNPNGTMTRGIVRRMSKGTTDMSARAMSAWRRVIVVVGLDDKGNRVLTVGIKNEATLSTPDMTGTWHALLRDTLVGGPGWQEGLFRLDGTGAASGDVVDDHGLRCAVNGSRSAINPDGTGAGQVESVCDDGTQRHTEIPTLTLRIANDVAVSVAR